MARSVLDLDLYRGWVFATPQWRPPPRAILSAPDAVRRPDGFRRHRLDFGNPMHPEFDAQLCLELWSSAPNGTSVNLSSTTFGNISVIRQPWPIRRGAGEPLERVGSRRSILNLPRASALHSKTLSDIINLVGEPLACVQPSRSVSCPARRSRRTPQKAALPQ